MSRRWFNMSFSTLILKTYWDHGEYVWIHELFNTFCLHGLHLLTNAFGPKRCLKRPDDARLWCRVLPSRHANLLHSVTYLGEKYKVITSKKCSCEIHGLMNNIASGGSLPSLRALCTLPHPKANLGRTAKFPLPDSNVFFLGNFPSKSFSSRAISYQITQLEISLGWLNSFLIPPLHMSLPRHVPIASTLKKQLADFGPFLVEKRTSAWWKACCHCSVIVHLRWHVVVPLLQPLPLRPEEGPDQTDGGHEGRSGSTEEGRLMVAAGENKRWPRQIVSQFGIRLELGRFHKVRNLWADTPFK